MPVKTIFSVCSRTSSIFQIFPLTMNQRPETATLLPSGLVYLLLCFLSKVSTDYFLRLFNVCLLLKQKNWGLWKISALLVTYNLLLWRPIVICNRCNVVSSHKCLTYTNQTSCTMSFNRKLIKIFGEKFTGGYSREFWIGVCRKMTPYSRKKQTCGLKMRYVYYPLNGYCKIILLILKRIHQL